KYQRYSPLVEVRVAELASESNYRESARILSEWTPVSMSHTTVGKIIERVGEAQSNADKISVDELDIAATLPEGKKVDLLYAEAGGVFLHDVSFSLFREQTHRLLQNVKRWIFYMLKQTVCLFAEQRKGNIMKFIMVLHMKVGVRMENVCPL